MSLFNFRAPALPLPPDEYNRQQFDEQARALRLYFNRLDSDFTTLINADGGSNLSFPHIAASDSTDQRATADDTIQVINFDTLESSSGWTLNPPGSATTEYPGVFTIRYSLQFANTDNAQHTVTVWIQVNGSDVANSATTFSVPARKSASIPGFICAYSEATFTVDAGDEVELYFATDKADIVSPSADGVFMFHDAAQVSPFARPAIPSAIGSITFVAALP
jgi:plastocyanin